MTNNFLGKKENTASLFTTNFTIRSTEFFSSYIFAYIRAESFGRRFCRNSFGSNDVRFEDSNYSNFHNKEIQEEASFFLFRIKC